MTETLAYNRAGLFHERRRYFRYGLRTPFPVLVEDASLGEALGLGEALEIGTGGLCIGKLPLTARAQSGDELTVTMLARERELPLRGRLVRHDGPHFGVAMKLTDDECDELERLLIEASF